MTMRHVIVPFGVTQFSTSENIPLQPPYSPDVSPRVTFFGCPESNKEPSVGGTHFEWAVTDIRTSATRTLQGPAAEGSRECHGNRKNRWTRYGAVRGEYVEGDRVY